MLGARNKMNKQELVKKLSDIEWEDFEVKEAKSEVPKNSWETVSAFSNTAGGWIVFGVKKEGKEYTVLGVNNSDKVCNDFIGILRNVDKFNKKIEVKCKKYDFEGKTVLAFYIPQRHPREKPIYFNTQKNTFIRTASGDQRATQEEIDSFFRNASFEEKDRELTKFSIKDLDEETIKRYRNFFFTVNPTHVYNGFKDEEFLEKLGVLKDKKVTYGGLLVFGKENILSGELTNYRIEYLEIEGISYEDAPTRYNFRISSEKNLFITFFDIYERLTKKIEVSFSIKQGIRDDDPPELQAIREALVNLIIHTDYFSKANARIRVFSDRFEFYNPGALPKKIELILKEDFSLPRNPIIAKTFRFIKFSENIGSGFHKMIDGWKHKFHLEPITEGDFDFYKITFPTTTTTKTTTYTTTNISRREGKEKEILNIISNNPYLSSDDISKTVGLTKEGVRYHLKNLKKKRLVKRKGHGKGGSWEVL
jgi:ATP-dependent DNA helicase RecG